MPPRLRLYITLMAAICLSCAYAATPGNPRKSLRQAEKMASDYTQASKARTLIAEALSDSALSAEAHTWWVAARVEREDFKHYTKLLSINRNDPKVDHAAMADALCSAISYMDKCMALDTTYDKKGKLKTRYSTEIAEWIETTAPSLYNAGVAYMHKKLYYPKGYQAFMNYAELPNRSYLSQAGLISDSLRANAYFYAGVMAYNGHEYEHAYQAFDKARSHGYTKKEVYLNQISSLSHLIQQGSAHKDSLEHAITEVAKAGLTHHGVDATPVFMQKYIAGCLVDGIPEQGLTAIDSTLVTHPDMVMLHTMKAGLQAAMGDSVAATQTYKKAASYQDADLNTLKSASKYLAQCGISALNALPLRKKGSKAKAKQIKDEYLAPALEFGRRAEALAPSDPEVSNVIETVSYNMH